MLISMVKLGFSAIYICSIITFSFIGPTRADEKMLTDQDKYDLIHQYKLHENLPLAEQIRLTDLKTYADSCFTVRSSLLTPSSLVQIPCSVFEENLIRNTKLHSSSPNYQHNKTLNNGTDSPINVKNDIYTKLIYMSYRENKDISKTIKLNGGTGNVFYQQVEMLDQIESLELWTTNDTASVVVDYIHLVDTNTGSTRCISVRRPVDQHQIHVDVQDSDARFCQDHLPMNHRNKREASVEQNELTNDYDDDQWGLKISHGNESNEEGNHAAVPMAAHGFHMNQIRGGVYGGDGGSAFDDSSIFPSDNSIVSDFTPSKYHVTYCLLHGLSIQLTYEATLRNGSKISKVAPRHGVEHSCSSHTILLNGNAISKVVIVHETFGSDGSPRFMAISGIQFSTDQWSSPFYGSQSGSVATESSSSHRLGYLTGRHGYLIDQLQLVWIRPQPHQQTGTTTTMAAATTTLATDMCAIKCLNPSGGRACIPKVWMCDGDRDCDDGSDEDPKHCLNSCPDQNIKCADSTKGLVCIHKVWMCDGEIDCPDASDEDQKYCQSSGSITTSTTTTTTTKRTTTKATTTTTTTTVPTMSSPGPNMCAIQCVNPGDGRKCIPKLWFCDGESDCADGSDEDPKYCGKTCEAGKIGCVNPGSGATCIFGSSMCDGKKDCLDGSDEDIKYCNQTKKISPIVCGRYRCLHGSTCDQTQQVCVCPDGYTGLDCSLKCGVPRIKPRFRRRASIEKKNNTDALVSIINGLEAIPHSWPWMVWLYVGGYSCGGMLIDDQHVLTAAHCTEESDVTRYQLYIGAVEYGGRANGRTVPYQTVSKRYQHPQYSKAMIQNDISILKLSQRVPMSDTIGYVCLPRTLSPDVTSGDIVVVTGWGQTSADRRTSPTVPDRLMQTRIKILDSSSCQYTGYVEQQQICAGGSNLGRTGICSGDSGGPLVREVNGTWVLFGITSYSHIDQCAHPTFADGFTRVKFYRSWINEQLKSS